MSGETERPSVFGEVDQDAMIARIEASTADEESSHFLRPLLDSAHQDSDRSFDSGVRVLGGDTPPVAAPPGVPEAPVLIRGELAADPRAVRAFIISGPAGITRPDDRAPSGAGRR